MSYSSPRSRSPSPSISRSRSRTPDSYSGYSDDSFASDTESYRPKPPIKNNKAKGPQKSNLTRKNVNQKYGKGPNKKPGVSRQSKVSKDTGRSPRDGGDYVAQRMLSARRLKINELKNQIESLHQELIDCQNENRVLRRQHIIHEKALEKYEFQETDLPQIIQRHNNEMRTLKEQLKRVKEKSSKQDQKYKDMQMENDKNLKHIRKLKSVVNNKGLGERDDLSRKLTQLESDFEERDKRARDLERHVEHLQKNHKHELGIERARHRETQRRLLDLQAQNEKITLALKEREKELDVRNIYSMRVLKAPHRVGSNVSSERTTPLSREKPTPRQKRHKGVTDKKSSRSTPKVPLAPPSPSKSEPSNISQEIETIASPVKDDSALSNREQEEEEQELRELEERQRKDAEQKRLLEEEIQRKFEEEKREQIRQEQLEKEEKERTKREEEEQKRLRQEQEKKEEEERVQKEREEAERRAQEEKERLANNESERERQRQKELLLAKMKAIDEGKLGAVVLSPESQRKKYNFTQETENLHNGQPSSPTRSKPSFLQGSPTQSKPSFLDSPPTRAKGRPSFLDDVEYKPTFTNDDKQKQRNDSSRRKNLMNNLFGGEAVNSNNTENGFQDDDLDQDRYMLSPTTKRKVQNSRRNLGTPEDRGESAKLLPRRQTQQSASLINNRSIVSSIDDLDDDIEEVTL